MPTNFQQLQAQAKKLVAGAMASGELSVRPPVRVLTGGPVGGRTAKEERRARKVESMRRWRSGLPTAFRRTKRMLRAGQDPLGGREFAPATWKLIEALKLLPVATGTAEDKYLVWAGTYQTIYKAADAAGVRVESTLVAGARRVFRVK